MRRDETLPRPTFSAQDGNRDDLDGLLACVPVAAVFLDEALRVRRFTPAVQEIYELGPADIGRPLSDIAHRVRELPPLPAALLEAQAPVRDELATLSGRVYERSALPLRGPGGRVTGVVLVFRDATERRAAAETQRFAERFLSLMSHDLRNPLAAIKLTAASMMRRAEAAPFQRQLTRIDGSANRIERMIGQLLDLGRVRIGSGLRIKIAPADLGEIARAIHGELPPADREGLQLSCDGDLAGAWDAERLAQLLANLAGNARQHCAAGTTATLRVHGRGDEVLIEVRNQGAVPAAVRPHLFSPLPMVEGLGPRSGAGLGLGLWLCRQIAEGHGGSIDLRCDGEETLVAVRLPRRLA